MSFSQSASEAISATATTTVVATNAFSVNALADAAGGTSLSAPSISVIDLDGAIFKLIVAGRGSGSIYVSCGSVQIARITTSSSPNNFLAEIILAWDSAMGTLTADSPDTYVVIENIPLTISSQSELTFSVSGATAVTQFTMKLL